MLADPLAIDVDDRPRALPASPPGPAARRGSRHSGTKQISWLSGLSAVASAEAAGDLPDLGLGQLAEREPGVLELVLAEAVEEVGLVLLLVAGPPEPGPPVRPDVPPGVVAGRDRLAVVQVPGLPQAAPRT